MAVGGAEVERGCERTEAEEGRTERGREGTPVSGLRSDTQFAAERRLTSKPGHCNSTAMQKESCQSKQASSWPCIHPPQQPVSQPCRGARLAHSLDGQLTQFVTRREPGGRTE